MTRMRLNTKWMSIVSHIVGSVTLAVLLLNTQSIVVAQGTNERWVGTWATSAVMRPRSPEGQTPAAQPAQADDSMNMADADSMTGMRRRLQPVQNETASAPTKVGAIG